MSFDFPTEDECEIAGADSVKDGANSINCHFRFFGTIELTKAWERGRNQAELNMVKS